MGPILDALRKLGGSGKPQEVINEIIVAQKVSEEERNAKITSGMSRFQNQVHWGRQYLIWEGLLESTKRGIWKLSEKRRTTHLTEDDSHKIFLKWVAISEGKDPLLMENQIHIRLSNAQKTQALILKFYKAGFEQSSGKGRPFYMVRQERGRLLWPAHWQSILSAKLMVLSI